MITYDDFSKIEIKIGKVINAEKVPETDKLLKLEVDFGPPATPERSDGGQAKNDIRTIVSGIAHVISIEDIIGKEVPFVTNLEPRTIRGIESNGMIMVAIDENENPVLLNPTQELKPGSIVR